MADIRDTETVSPLQELETRAHLLAARIPSLLVEAQRVSHTVTHGIHGRRRAGPGETFWQFRHFENSDSAGNIDWRRSASSDHLYVREREWEAAHTAWLWADISASMQFQSHLSSTTKAERAIVLALAMGELLVRGGERIGLLGERPRTGRTAVASWRNRFHVALAKITIPKACPPPQQSGGFLGMHFVFPIFLSRWRCWRHGWSDLPFRACVAIWFKFFDPAEETLPYSGRTEFIASEGGEQMIAGRAETLRERYSDRSDSTPAGVDGGAQTTRMAHAPASHRPVRRRKSCSRCMPGWQGLNMIIAIVLRATNQV